MTRKQYDGKGLTLADTLSPELRNQMNRLSDDLKKQASKVIETQREEPKPPWQGRVIRNTRKPEVRKNLRSSSVTQSFASDSKSQESEFKFWDFPSEATVSEHPPTIINENEKNVC